MERKTLIVADSHLAGEGPEWTVFREMLRKISESDFNAAFLGDIFELWIASPGYETAIHREFLDWCTAEKTKRNLWFMEGNHEFYVGRNHADSFTAVSDLELFLDGGRFYLTHGDTVNRKDSAYRFLRALLRNRIAERIVALFGPVCGRPVSESIRKGLKNTNMKQKKYYPEAELNELAGRLAEAGVEAGAAGHFHRAGKAGILTLLPNWEPPLRIVGVYTPGKREIELLPAERLFGKLSS